MTNSKKNLDGKTETTLLLKIIFSDSKSKIWAPTPHVLGVFRAPKIFQYMSYYKKCSRLDDKIEQIWDLIYYKNFQFWVIKHIFQLPGGAQTQKTSLRDHFFVNKFGNVCPSSSKFPSLPHEWCDATYCLDVFGDGMSRRTCMAIRLHIFRFYYTSSIPVIPSVKSFYR